MGNLADKPDTTYSDTRSDGIVVLLSSLLNFQHIELDLLRTTFFKNDLHEQQFLELIKVTTFLCQVKICCGAFTQQV